MISSSELLGYLKRVKSNLIYEVSSNLIKIIINILSKCEIEAHAHMKNSILKFAIWKQGNIDI